MAGCGAVIALAAVVGSTGTWAPTVRFEQLQDPRFGADPPAYPPAMGGPDIVQPASPTASESRRKIVDASDLHAAVSKITAQSPTIDKLAASDVLLACADFRPRRQRDSEEQSAAQELAGRCAGIRKNMRRNDAIERAVELRASAESDSAPLGRLAALSRRSDGGKVRWYAAEFALVSAALKSNDSVLIGEAIRALQAQLDDGLPDSRLRSLALATAADLYVHKYDQRTLFDTLVECANLGQCTSTFGRDVAHDIVPGGVRERSEIQRLIKQYGLALQGATSAEQLLATR